MSEDLDTIDGSKCSDNFSDLPKSLKEKLDSF